jgi:hypothetical protein
MSSPSVELHGFVYGEHLEGVPQRSLGYCLLAPVEPEPWTAEVEALARRLQAAPYPDTWPPAELFCSVLLEDGRRLVALARYGLADHTTSQRRGGLELIGVVAPGNLGISSALAIYRWLRKRRAEVEDLRTLAGRPRLGDIIATAPDLPDPVGRLPVQPVRLWQQGTLLCAAMAPSDPDQRLALLEEGAGEKWQWLPLVGADFPLPIYAQRGPLVAWTPHLASLASKLGQKASGGGRRAIRHRAFQAVVGVTLMLLLAANLWSTLAMARRVPEPGPAEPALKPSSNETVPAPHHADNAAREQFAQALYRLLQQRHATKEWTQNQLIDQYQQLVAQDERLRMGSAEGKAAVGAVSLLSRRSAEHIEALVREALTSEELVNRTARRVRDRLAAEARERP